MVKHIVTFKLKGSPDERLEVAVKFKEALLTLPSRIEVLESMEVGINQNPSEHWDITLIARVPEMADVAVYASHPAHIEAASIIAPYKEDRACVDFYEE